MDILSVNDICAMLAGRNPNDVGYDYQYEGYFLAQYNNDEQRNTFDSLLKILTRAIRNKELKATIVVYNNTSNLTNIDLQKDWLVLAEIDTSQTTVTKVDLKAWLESKGVYPEVFFPNGRKDDYMNPNHEAYSPELALCVKAWETAQIADYPNQTPKQFMIDWIQANAKSYGANVQNNGKLGDKKADELASIANWATGGGAVKGNPLKKNKPTPLNDEPTPPLEYEQGIPDELKINLPENIAQNDNEDLPF